MHELATAACTFCCRLSRRGLPSSGQQSPEFNVHPEERGGGGFQETGSVALQGTIKNITAIPPVSHAVFKCKLKT